MRKINVVAALAVLLTSACTEEQGTGPVVSPQVDFEQGELANPEIQGKVVSVYYLGQLVEMELVDGEYIFQGDIHIPVDQLSFVEPPKAYRSPTRKAQAEHEADGLTIPFIMRLTLTCLTSAGLPMPLHTGRPTPL